MSVRKGRIAKGVRQRIDRGRRTPLVRGRGEGNAKRPAPAVRAAGSAASRGETGHVCGAAATMRGAFGAPRRPGRDR